MSRTPIFVKIVRPTYGRWLRRKYNVQTEGYERIPKEGPFLLLSNHVHTLDPFFISVTMNVHVRWVAGAYLFKNRLLKTMLGSWVTSIWRMEDLVERLVRWNIHPEDLVTHRFSLDQADEAYRLMASGACGKVAVCFDEELK